MSEDNPITKLAEAVSKLAEGFKTHKESSTAEVNALKERISTLESKANEPKADQQ